MLNLHSNFNTGLGSVLEADLAARYGTPSTRRALLSDLCDEHRVRHGATSTEQPSGSASAGLSAGVVAPQSPAPERTAANMPKQNPRIARQTLSLLVDQVAAARGWSRIKAMAAVVEAHPDLQEAACQEATQQLFDRQRAPRGW